MALSLAWSLESLTSADVPNAWEEPHASSCFSSIRSASETATIIPSPDLSFSEEDVFQVVMENFHALETELLDSLDRIEARFKSSLQWREQQTELENLSRKDTLQRQNNLISLWLSRWTAAIKARMAVESAGEHGSSKLLSDVSQDLQTMLKEQQQNLSEHLCQYGEIPRAVDRENLITLSNMLDEIVTKCHSHVETTVKELMETFPNLQTCQGVTNSNAVQMDDPFSPSLDWNVTLKPPHFLPPITGLSEKAKQLLLGGEIPELESQDRKGKKKGKGGKKKRKKCWKKKKLSLGQRLLRFFSGLNCFTTRVSQDIP